MPGLIGRIEMEDAMSKYTKEQPAHSAVARTLDAIADWVGRYRRAIGLRNELENCGADEVAHIARDLGVNPGDLVSMASKGEHAADQLPKLLRALGVDPDKLALGNAAMMRDLQRICITCSHKSRCEHDLASGTAGQRYHDYCPNAVSIDALFDKK